MIEIFKTNVQNIKDAYLIVGLLLKRFPDYKINFDLEDCDNILRVDGALVAPTDIVACINELGYECIAL